MSNSPPVAQIVLLDELPELAEPPRRVRLVARVVSLDVKNRVALVVDESHGLLVDYSDSIGDKVASYSPAIKDLIQVIGILVAPQAGQVSPPEPRKPFSSPKQIDKTQVLQAYLISHVENLDLGQWKRMASLMKS
ncbi:BQ5605_C001g00720 [Microbotryum silenes-dioicae]|uniref:BQ5605_C001g00720 protein n=1 Tax=Microbotryum silenes-dioicae TaxID=796604 RepID=A0A2X0M450_9BASI|nr:BQ5605_C001g00720 [Microbotryum silenes-dioicae]